MPQFAAGQFLGKIQALLYHVKLDDSSGLLSMAAPKVVPVHY